MGFIREKVEEIQGEVDSFIDQFRGEVGQLKTLLEGFGPEFVARIRALRPRIEAGKDEVLKKLDDIATEIDKFTE